MVSIIIPVYNTERYLTRCVDSLKAQSFGDIEIILIDDGSSDGSSDICNNLAASDNRIKVVHQANKGVSFARNAGLKIAHGEYICFVDSDDYVNERYVESMVTAAEQNNADLVITGRCQIKLDGISNTSTPPDTIMENYEIRNLFVDTAFDNTRGGPYCKLYKREIIEKYNLTFPQNIHYLEDAIFVLHYMLRCCKICAINESNYFYELHPGSLVFSVHDFNVESNGFALFQKLHQQLKTKFNLRGKENYWFDSNLDFLLYRQVKAFYSINNRQDKLQALQSINWAEYRRLNNKKGLKRKTLNLLTFNISGRLILNYLNIL